VLGDLLMCSLNILSVDEVLMLKRLFTNSSKHFSGGIYTLKSYQMSRIGITIYLEVFIRQGVGEHFIT
jgi:hypothetical protein